MMQPAITSFLAALLAVTLAEMGDKTQLLAMCFATRFSARKVLIGVFIATILNHALAVAVGVFLKEVLSQYNDWIQLAASLSFIGFALWTIKGDTIDESCDAKTRYGPVITVAIAFFIAEMGDKTQLATVSLAAGLSNPISVLVGTTLGMLDADGIGIIFGVVMNKRIPEKKLKWISASIFAICGIIGYVQAAQRLFSIFVLSVSLLAVLVATVILTVLITRWQSTGDAGGEIAATTQKRL